MQTPDPERRLTDRQASILSMVALGLTYEEAGKEHGLGVKRVTQIVAEARKALGARSLAHAIGLAILGEEIRLAEAPSDMPHQPEWVQARLDGTSSWWRGGALYYSRF